MIKCVRRGNPILLLWEASGQTRPSFFDLPDGFSAKKQADHDMTHRPTLLIALLIAALTMTAAGTIAAPNWMARSSALAMLVVLAAVCVHVLTERIPPRQSPWGGPPK